MRRQAVVRLIRELAGAGKKVDPKALIAQHPELMPELEIALKKIASRNAGETVSKITVAATRSVMMETVAPPVGGSQTGYAIPTNEPAIQIAGYSLQRELGRGGQAVVYLAVQENTGRRVAVKVMRPEALADERALARFKREVQVLAALEHPNIVGIMDTGVTASGAHYIVMNYVAGVTLDEYMKSRQRTESDPSKLLRLFLKICAAVNAAHVRGIVHRDLKPGNIRIDERGEPHILDFGLAHTPLDRLAGGDHPIAVTGEFLGSLPWCSPEQAEGDPDRIDMRTDVYSLGVILYQILTEGKFPYEVVGNMRDVLNNILTTEPVPPSKAAMNPGAGDRKPGKLGSPTVNPAIENIVLRALAKNRELRYQTAGELGRDLAQYLSGQQTAVRQKEIAPPPPAKRPAMSVAAIALGVVALCAIAVAAWMVARRTPAPGSGITPTATAAPTSAPSVAAAAPVAVPKIEAMGSSRNFISGIVGGTAHLEGDALALTPGKLNAAVDFGPVNLSDYDMSFDAMTNESGNGKGFRVLIHASMRNSCLFWVGEDEDTQLALYSRVGGTSARTQFKQYRLEPDEWYNVRVEVRGAEMRCFLDGQEVFDGREPRLTSGRAGISSSDASIRFRNIKLTAPDGTMIWQGPPDLSRMPPEQLDPPGDVAPPKIKKIDLLAGFTPGTDALLGTWTASADGLTGSGPAAQVQFHASLPDEFVYRVRFVRFSGKGPIALIASRGGRAFTYEIGGHDGTTTGFGVVDGKNYDDNETTRRAPRWTANGVEHTVVLRVRKDWILAYIDGVQHDRVSELSALALPADFKHDNTPPLGIWLGGDSVEIKSADIFELLPTAAPATMNAAEER